MVRILDLNDGFSSATPPSFVGDTAQVSFALTNNTTQDVTGMLFASADVKQVELTYIAKRQTDSQPRIDQGGCFVVYYDGTIWQLSERSIDGFDAGISFTVSSVGQIRVTTTNIAGANHTGTLDIRGEVLEVI